MCPDPGYSGQKSSFNTRSASQGQIAGNVDASSPVSFSASIKARRQARPIDLGNDRSEARIVLKQVLDIQSLAFDAQSPASTALCGLEPPLDEMQEQYGQPADQFPLFRLAHALDLLGDVPEIRIGDIAGAQQIRLFAAPSVKVSIVWGRLRAHECMLPFDAGFVHAPGTPLPERLCDNHIAA